MAAGIINLQKASGGITKISSADGTGVTELVVPESGNLVSVATTVADNAIARYDGTTGKLQNSGVIVNDSGNLLLTSGTGALGYGTGAGGTVTQLTSKSTAVTLNKPSGRIIISNSALGANATAGFILYNNLICASDTLTLSIPNLIANDISNYRVIHNLYNGGAAIFVTNVSGSTLSEAIAINFNLHKGTMS